MIKSHIATQQVDVKSKKGRGKREKEPASDIIERFERGSQTRTHRRNRKNKAEYGGMR
jgi:hypothetical protein